jgi:hypothetical protein
MVDINLGDRPPVPFIPVELTKARLDELLQAINEGKAIASTNGSWTVPELLALAGAAIAAVESHGPATWPAIFSADEFDLDQLHADDRELVIDRLRSFLGYAVGAYKNLALAAVCRHWSTLYEDAVQLMILEDGTVVGVSGVRPQAAG